MDPVEEALQRAIFTISQSDPIVKLLEQVRQGRMKAADAGLRAVTESWLATYRKTLGAAALTKSALRRLNPAPRTALLIESGILSADHRAVSDLQQLFEQTLSSAPE